MSKNERRAQVVSENNFAQSVLENVIETTNFSQTNDIHITSVLHGDLDFSILKDKQITNVKGIYIDSPGEVTNLFNIPDSVKIIECSNQMLNELRNLPLQIEKIDVSDNMLQSFDATDLSNLSELNISYNELIQLKNLPESLVYLNIESNQLRNIDLAETPNLKHLVCSNNPILLLSKVPPSLTKIEMENNPFLEIEHAGQEEKPEKSQKIDYLQGLKEYFKMKNTYEEAVRNLKRKAYKKGESKKERRKLVQDVKPTCVGCTRKVGTQFSYSDQHYNAKCGDPSKPCNMDISLFIGDYFRLEPMLELHHDDIEIDKQNIIVNKMNSIFKYIGDANSKQVFEKDIQEYKETSEIYKELLDNYDSIYNNEEDKEKLQKKQEEFYAIVEDMKILFEEYKKTGNSTILTTMIQTYNQSLIPCVDALRSMKYAHMFVETEMGDTAVSTLKQYTHSIYRKDFNYGEEPKVVKFIMN